MRHQFRGDTPTDGLPALSIASSTCIHGLAEIRPIAPRIAKEPMRIVFGKTRTVLVTSCNAYKVARIHPLNFIIRAVLFVVSRKQRKKFVTRVEGRFVEEVVTELKNAFSSGISANRTEYSYYGDSRDPRVVPTTKMLLGGLVVVQNAASPVSPNEFVNPFQRGKNLIGYFEVTCPRQFGWMDGKLLLLDYGQLSTCQFLQELREN
jgi:hypothetical protein